MTTQDDEYVRLRLVVTRLTTSSYDSDSTTRAITFQCGEFASPEAGGKLDDDVILVCMGYPS